jgi:hypothetical protein
MSVEKPRRSLATEVEDHRPVYVQQPGRAVDAVRRYVIGGGRVRRRVRRSHENLVTPQ